MTPDLPSPRAPSLRQMRATWRTVWAAIWRVRRSLLALIGVLLGGTLVFWLGEGRRIVEAFFYSLNLITLQAGPSDVPQAPLFQAVAVLVMVGGLISLTGGVASLFQLISDPKERQLSLAATMNDHIVVCGVGRVGYRVINELVSQGETVVAINAHEQEEWIEPFRKRGIAVLIADARQRQTLINAGIERASAIVACTSDDLTNLDIALDARDINPKIKVVLRMFDAKLAEKVSKGFNIQTAYSVSALAAPALAAAAMRYKVDYSFKLHGELLNVTTVCFKKPSPYIGHTLEQVAQSANCSFISRETEQGLQMHPAPGTVIGEGDVYNIVGSIQAIQALQRS